MFSVVFAHSGKRLAFTASNVDVDLAVCAQSFISSGRSACTGRRHDLFEKLLPLEKFVQHWVFFRGVQPPDLDVRAYLLASMFQNALLRYWLCQALIKDDANWQLYQLNDLQRMCMARATTALV